MKVPLDTWLSICLRNKQLDSALVLCNQNIRSWDLVQTLGILALANVKSNVSHGSVYVLDIRLETRH